MGQKLFKQKYQAAEDYLGDDDYNEETYLELMSLARLELLAYAEEALQADNEDLYSALSFDIEILQLTEDSFPETNFALILNLIKDPRFLKSEYGWPFLMIFHSEWEKITEQQKTILLDALAEIYEKFDDWMPCFSISELVGEDFHPSQAYSFFNKFAASPNETARAFVPHGYEHALRNSADAELTAKLWNALLDMEQDESEKVRGEVEETLFRLENHGLKRP